MGFARGVDIFDAMEEYLLGSDIPDYLKFEFTKRLIEVLDNNDWDTHSDSEYYQNSIVIRALKATGNWYEDKE